MAIEIVDLPLKSDDFPVRYVSLPEATHAGTLKQAPENMKSRNVMVHIGLIQKNFYGTTICQTLSNIWISL